jgi:hypothetical protein
MVNDITYSAHPHLNNHAEQIETYAAITMASAGYMYMPDCTAGVHKSQAKARQNLGSTA